MTDGQSADSTDDASTAKNTATCHSDRGSFTASRRDVIKSSAAGILPIGFATRSESTEEIPILHNGEEVVKWKEVPSSWVEHKDHAIDVRQNTGESLLNREGVHAIALIPSSETYGGKPGRQIELEVENGKRDKIPDEVDGIPIKKVEPRERKDKTCYNSSYDDFPGGVAVSTDSSGSEVGSTGISVYLGGGKYGITSAYHLTSSGDIYGDYDGSSWQNIGSVFTGIGDMDVIVIESSRSFPSDVKDESGTVSQAGYVTEDGIVDRADAAFDGYRKMGITTGETTGGIGAHHVEETPDDDSFGDYHGHGVRGSAGMAAGDSGGIAYSMHNGDAYATNITTQSGGDVYNYDNCRNKPVSYKSYGTAAYHINEHWDVVGSSHS